jgi:N-acetylglucosamine-6-phosphate deacetylase
VFTPHHVRERQAVAVSDDGQIAFTGAVEDAPRVDGLHLNLGGKIVAPGFIDIHVHGGNGISFDNEDPAAGLAAYSAWVASNGVTGFLLSIAAPDADALTRLTGTYSSLFGGDFPGAEPLGLHLEGPFINREKKGAFNPSWIRPASVPEAKQFLEAGQGWIRQVTMAPETPGADAVAKEFRRAGVVVALGHSNTDYATASRALAGNFTHVTHAFNAQSSFDHRAPGVFGAVLASDAITAELIADGIHVHPGAMKVLIRCLGTDRVALITDAILGAGFPDGQYELVGNEVFVHDGRATLANGTLAGSIANLNQCVRNVNRLAGYPLHQAVKMASLVPATAIGVADRVGSITPGKDASLVVIDEEVNIYLTLVKGKVAYMNL